MHIPDGFVSPKVYLPAYAAAGILWAVAARRIHRRLAEETVPRLAVMTAVAFVLMMVAIPLPGGTSVHASGIGMLAVLFGGWAGFLSLSFVLLIQATVFGAGGVTSLPLNALAMGFAGSWTAIAAHRLLRRWSETAALFAAGWLGMNVAALILAVVLGIQPAIARKPDGTPLFFPFGLRTTIPAVMIPHLVVGIGEGLLTVLSFRLLARRGHRPT